MGKPNEQPHAPGIGDARLAGSTGGSQVWSQPWFFGWIQGARNHSSNANANIHQMFKMSSCFEMAITFSGDVLRRRDHAGLKEQAELRRFYMFKKPWRPDPALKKSNSFFSVT